MNYDDGCIKSLEVKKTELPDGYVRTFMLGNGDVIQLFNLLLEYKDGVFHEVKEPVGIVNPHYKRTGKVYTPNELNKLFR